MVWGFIRITLFCVAFLFGLFAGESVNSDSDSIPRLDESTGTSLVVACEEGDVLVTPLLQESGAVQLSCLRSQMWIARDELEKIPDRGRNTKNHMKPIAAHLSVK